MCFIGKALLFKTECLNGWNNSTENVSIWWWSHAGWCAEDANGCSHLLGLNKERTKRG